MGEMKLLLDLRGEAAPFVRTHRVPLSYETMKSRSLGTIR
jgi:hypothetical protein